MKKPLPQNVILAKAGMTKEIVFHLKRAGIFLRGEASSFQKRIEKKKESENSRGEF